MKIKNKIFYIIAFVAMFWTSITQAYYCPQQYRAYSPLYVNTSVLNGEIQWTGSTSYSSYWNYGINTWNDEDDIYISYIGNWWLADLEVNDIDSSSAVWAGHWYNYPLNFPDKIKFNKNKMKKYNYKQKRNTTIHELGHALGLKHSPNGNVMYKYTTSKTNLGWQDKQCYNYNWD